MTEDEAQEAAQPYPILRSLTSPAEIRSLSAKELAELTDEVRQAILNEVSKTGGHFASNLGAVEIAVALFAVFEPPKDVIVWDTGHQAYAHKILSGRLDRFPTLRKYKGLSGFLRREESEFDAFGAGHAGTSISAALGFALARDALGEDRRVAAVTGDAAIASGMSWEALNHGGSLGVDFTVILNDNRMSIAENVGALTNHLARLRSRPDLQTIAARAKGVVEKFPEPVTKVAAGLRHGITHYLAPNETGAIFEELGFEYIGPIDGHDLPTLIAVLRNIRTLRKPTFVHALTVKGKGYTESEEDARKWHAVVPFELEAHEMVKAAGPKTFTQAFGEAAMAAASADPKVVAITAAMPDGTGLNGFAKAFPKRFHDVGIAEQHAVTLAAGMAAGGLKPFCAVYSTFLQRGYDQVVHDTALQDLPVRFFLDRAGLVGDDGPTHHGAFDLSYLASIPNMVVLAARDTDELKTMTEWMTGFDEHPSALRYPRGAGDLDLPEARSPIALGKAETLVAGTDVAIVAIGSMVAPAYRAAKALKELGIDAGVINARFAKPIDTEAIRRAVAASGALVTVEENAQAGGFGEAVRGLLDEEIRAGLKLKVMALPDRFIQHGSQKLLRREVGLDEEGIMAAVHELLGRATAIVSDREPARKGTL